MRYVDGGGLTAKGRQRREEVRLEAAGLFADGLGPPEVARRLRVSSKSAYRWRQEWMEGGVAALASRGTSGRRCKLSARCQEKLAAYLEQGPAAHGWDEDQVWTGARVATLIGRKFHVWPRAAGARPCPWVTGARHVSTGYPFGPGALSSSAAETSGRLRGLVTVSGHRGFPVHYRDLPANSWRGWWLRRPSMLT
ncbi:transposase [Kitasatospora sp. NPDC059817]|uniref:helix-turn-helix domain-containing protein n=1 Tax=Kitasatospora sp. NPDC059817 TaxID=3346961 RepID=UPI00365040E1